MLRRRSAPAGASRPTLAVTAAAITGAVGFAVAQPLYDLLGRNATFFIAHQADGLDLLWLCGLLSLGLPLTLTLAVAVSGLLGDGLRRLSLGFVLALCSALFGLGAVRSLGGPGWLAIAAALALGVGAALLSRRPTVVRGIALLGLGGLVFPALFFAQPDVRAVWESPEPAAEPAADTTAGMSSPAGPVTDTPVVVVVFDEMPTASLMTPGREIDAGRYPHFARLAATATWYREATTVSQATIYAVPAILTGNYPEAKVRKSPSARDYKRNLFRSSARRSTSTSGRRCRTSAPTSSAARRSAGSSRAANG